MSGCVQCGRARMAGRRVCATCYNAQQRARYASPRSLARTQGRRTSKDRPQHEAWCWGCQETHERTAIVRNRAKTSGRGTGVRWRLQLPPETDR